MKYLKGKSEERLVYYMVGFLRYNEKEKLVKEIEE